MKKLTPEQVVFVYNKVSGCTYSIDASQVSYNTIQSILKKAWGRTEDGTQYVYTYLQLKAAVMCMEIAKQKPFPDFNLNVAVLASLTLLELNGVIIKLDEASARQLSFLISRKETEYSDLADWFISHTEKSTK